MLRGIGEAEGLAEGPVRLGAAGVTGRLSLSLLFPPPCPPKPDPPDTGSLRYSPEETALKSLSGIDTDAQIPLRPDLTVMLW